MTTMEMPTAAATSTSRFNDPFNYPMPNRCDLMSLSTINVEKDAMKTTTSKFISKRGQSMNLSANDIDGKL